MASTLVLVRHGQSEWNKKNLFTGWKDVALTDQGRTEAHAAGKRLKAEGLRFDMAFTSALQRAQHTLNIILEEMGQSDIPITKDERLNERDYGDLTGLNKDDAREKWGEEQVHIWRRSFDIPPPGGESLKLTAERVLPYFDTDVRPQLTDDKTIIIAAHGNSLRALIMRLEDISEEDITQLNLATGIPMIYRLDDALNIESKRELS